MYEFIRSARFWVIIAFMLGFLAACGGGSTGAAPVQFADASLGASSAGEVTPDTPLTGQASYSGFMRVSVPDGDRPTDTPIELSGDLSLNVDFESPGAQLDGMAEAFRTPDDDAVAGRLFVTDGQVLKDGVASYRLDAALSGTLSGPNFRNVVLIGTLQGDFAGTDLGALNGFTVGQTSTIYGTGAFDGKFAVGRD